jgi:hypothetical protein
MPASSDVDVYRRMVRRVAWLVLAIGLAGSVAAAVLRGIAFGAAFLLGAALSGASLWRWKKMADTLGGPSSRRSAFAWVMQLVLVIAAAFVIIVYLKVTAVAVFLGLLVSAAAIIVAILFELIWNMNSG